MNKGQNSNILIAVGIIFVAILSRFILPYNVSPIGAIGLFGAAHFGKKWMAFLLPFAALWLSNLFLNNVVYAQYYDSFQWFGNLYVYAAFALVILFGIFFLKKINSSRLFGSAIVATLLFYVITNFGVWAGGTMIAAYPMTTAGLITCYVAGIPFLGWSLLGNLIFCAALFYSYEWIKVDELETVPVS